ncbi:hypothetical protein [Cryobacterium glucosi]|uniref:Uncharacterized protein n=1 Tax=Cryobacterium glucosi TaxID=1259175 RepID=A0ABY2IPN2_9MICO|nr:hypothetical protein [Cryobacterium glucosi]TFC21864.1 hypothetical protein E3O46_06580 [Cryobacterium glucosi]
MSWPAEGAIVNLDGGGYVRVDWDESYFDAQQEEASIYWVCFWTGDDIEQPARHDPQRITGVTSIEEVLAWLHTTKGERRFELFVETRDHTDTRESRWISYRKLIRLAGDFQPAGSSVTVNFTRPE